MRLLATTSIFAVSVWAVAASLPAAEPSGIGQRPPAGIGVAYPLTQSLFGPVDRAASFQLREPAAMDRPSPEREMLSATANQQAIADLLKEERNKGIRPDTVPLGDKDSKGIKVRFDGIRFLKDPRDPNVVRIRLVGPINEVECKQPLSIATLLTSREPIPVRFESVTRNTGVTVTITTDVKIRLQNGVLHVTDTKGSIDFSVGRFSPARLVYSSDADSVALPDLVGRRVGEEALPFRPLLEPEKL